MSDYTEFDYLIDLRRSLLAQVKAVERRIEALKAEKVCYNTPINLIQPGATHTGPPQPIIQASALRPPD